MLTCEALLPVVWGFFFALLLGAVGLFSLSSHEKPFLAIFCFLFILIAKFSLLVNFSKLASFVVVLLLYLSFSWWEVDSALPLLLLYLCCFIYICPFMMFRLHCWAQTILKRGNGSCKPIRVISLSGGLLINNAFSVLQICRDVSALCSE